MPRGTGPRQPRWAKQGFGVGRPKAAVKTVAKKKAAPRAAAKRAPGKAKGYDPIAPERVEQVLARLDATYPVATCALGHKSAWELLVATILSAQCTDERVNKVTPILFAKYP